MSWKCQGACCWILLFGAAIALVGCTRAHYRNQADMEAYSVISERNHDPRWASSDVAIDIDPRSRYFDPYDPDCPPMPADDPTAQQYMKVVDGKRGWKHWQDFGQRPELENPIWFEALNDYSEVKDDGTVYLNVNSALKLAYVHSPSYQSQLETLYLSALDVTAERFRLDAQFFGGYDAFYNHNGKLLPAGLGFSPLFRRFVVTPPIEGVENNRLTVGRPFAGNPALQVRRSFATAGELLVGFANSFVFEFTGGDANLSASLANFTIMQPLLRGAGRDIALEPLTFSERTLLSNLRAYSQFRQGFYTQVALGSVGVQGPNRGGPSTSIFSQADTSARGGFIGLLRQRQEIRNLETNLILQRKTLDQLEALLDVGVIDLVQVDRFRQQYEQTRAGLAQAENSYQLALDTYKTSVLGLPPDLQIELDEGLIEQFQLVSEDANRLQDALSELQLRVGEINADSSVEELQGILQDSAQLIEPVRLQFESIQTDLARLGIAVPSREERMTEDEKKEFADDRDQLTSTMKALDTKFHESKVNLELMRDKLTEANIDPTARQLVAWLSDLLRTVQRSVLIQARARLETVTVELINLESRDAFGIALENRLDFMNARTALVDSWRLTQVSADALQSVVNITSSGNIRTARNNPLSFRAPTGNLRLGLEFDAPLTRLLERNSYRESQINYQRNRRSLIRSRDNLHLSLRELLRQLERLRFTMEVQRRAVAIAIRQVDQTRARLYEPVPPAPPGGGVAQFGSTTAIDLLNALNSLRSTQNEFLGRWLEYYAARMVLYRELGVMMLDEEGRWIETPPNGLAPGTADPAGAELLPPIGEEPFNRLPPPQE